ncbi:MAG TPA: tetratricopeptide repeat protein [Myxococcota bacterium]|nr:tetratricopeptide repeat protein [Myxococcota bacterium]
MNDRKLCCAGLACTAALLFFLGACSSNQEKVQRYLDQGAAYAKEGKTKEALLLLRNALNLDPKNAETNYRIAKLLEEEGNYADAVFYLRETERLDPNRSDAPLDEAKLLLGEDLTRADELVTGVLTREPSNPMAHLRRMEVELRAGDTQQALAEAKTAIELAPKDGLYQLQLGIVHQARVRELRTQGKTPPDDIFQAAVDAFHKSDELYGGNVTVRLYLGETYLGWPNHRDEAAVAFRSAIDLAEEKGDVKDKKRAAGAGVQYARTANDPAFEEFALEKLVAADESNLAAWGQLADLHEAKDGGGEAVYHRLLEKRPDDLDAQWHFATWLFQKGRGDDALAQLKEAARKSNSRARALDMLSGLQLQMNKTDEAYQTIATLKKEFPGDPSTQLATARADTFAGRYEEAAPVLRSLASSQESPDALRLLAVTEFHLHNYPAALAAVDRSLALAPEPSTEVMLLKARIHSASRDWPLTIQTYMQLVRNDAAIPPRDLALLAAALYETNQPAAAKQVLDGVLASPEPPFNAVIEFAAREGDKSPNEARKHLEAALARAPTQPDLLLAITQIDVRAGRTNEALARLNAVIESGKAPPAALLARARLLAGQKQFDAAEKDVSRVLESSPDTPGAPELLVQIYAAQNKLDEAVKNLEEADKAGALAPSARLLLGRLYVSRGDDAKARAMFERVLSERSDLAGAKNDLAFLLAKDGVELDRALRLATEAQQALANDPNVADTLSFVYLKKGLNEPALQQANYAIQLAEEAREPQAIFQYHLGLVLRALGRNPEAAQAFERALAIDDKFAEAGAARQELEAARAESKAPPGSS